MPFIPSCPPEIVALMKLPVQWEKFLGFDGHAEPTYAPSITKLCFREAHSMLQTGLEAVRQAEIGWKDPDFDLYFSGDDPDAILFTLWDRWAVGGVGEGGPDVVDKTKLQPSAINTIAGPPDRTPNPWLIVVSF